MHVVAEGFQGESINDLRCVLRAIELVRPEPTVDDKSEKRPESYPNRSVPK